MRLDLELGMDAYPACPEALAARFEDATAPPDGSYPSTQQQPWLKQHKLNKVN